MHGRLSLVDTQPTLPQRTTTTSTTTRRLHQNHQERHYHRQGGNPIRTQDRIRMASPLSFAQTQTGVTSTGDTSVAGSLLQRMRCRSVHGDGATHRQTLDSSHRLFRTVVSTSGATMHLHHTPCALRGPGHQDNRIVHHKTLQLGSQGIQLPHSTVATTNRTTFLSSIGL